MIRSWREAPMKSRSLSISDWAAMPGGAVGSGKPRYSTSNRARSQSEPMNTGLRIRWILRWAAKYVSEGISSSWSTLGWRISWTTR